MYVLFKCIYSIYHLQVLRYVLLTHRLIFMQARGITDMSTLPRLNFVTPDEYAMLKHRPNKALIVWSWCVFSMLVLGFLCVLRASR